MPVYTPNDRQIDMFKNTFTLKKITEDQQKRMIVLRNKAKELGVLVMQYCPDRRETSLAMTALQDVINWSDAAIMNGEKGVPVSMVSNTDVTPDVVMPK